MTETELHPHRGDASDAELISRVRGGDVSAYGDLFARHRDAATRLARQLVSPSDADDLVSEAFAKVLNVLLGGGGPDVAFRAYLLTAVRRLHVDKVRSVARATPTDDLTQYDPGEEFTDTALADFEGAAAAKAFLSLPERWQLVLWHLEIENQKPADVAPLLGMSPNAVSALAYRAREGLRQAYLQMHAADLAGEDCRWTHDRLGAYVRRGLSRRDAAKVETHLDGCRSCTAAYLELTEVNASLSGLIGPLVLGSAASGYLAAGSATSNSALAAAIMRMSEIAKANGQVVAGIAGAVGVATLTTIAVAISGGGPGPQQAIDEPTVITTQVPGPLKPTPTPTTPTEKPQVQNPTTPVTSPSTSSPSAGPTTSPGSPSPKPTPKPTPPPTSPPTTPTVPPVNRSSDVSVKLSFQLAPNLADPAESGTMEATVDGVPDGQESTFTVRSLGGTLVPIPSSARESGTTPPCTVTGSTATCKAGPGRSTVKFKVRGLSISASAAADVPKDFVDPNMRNNTDSLLLGLL